MSWVDWIQPWLHSSRFARRPSPGYRSKADRQKPRLPTTLRSGIANPALDPQNDDGLGARGHLRDRWPRSDADLAQLISTAALAATPGANCKFCAWASTYKTVGPAARPPTPRHAPTFPTPPHLSKPFT